MTLANVLELAQHFASHSLENGQVTLDLRDIMSITQFKHSKIMYSNRGKLAFRYISRSHNKVEIQ